MYGLKKVVSSYTYDGELETQTYQIGTDQSESNLRDRFNAWAELPQQREDHGTLLYMYPYNNSCRYPAKTEKYASVDVQYIIEFIQKDQNVAQFDGEE